MNMDTHTVIILSQIVDDMTAQATSLDRAAANARRINNRTMAGYFLGQAEVSLEVVRKLQNLLAERD
jgi:hypothetical protein